MCAYCIHPMPNAQNLSVTSVESQYLLVMELVRCFYSGKTVDQEVGNSLPREKTQPAAKEDRIQCPYRNDQGCNRTATLAKAKSLVVHMNAHIYPKRCNDHFLTHFIHKKWS
ncbi:hypothetical protein MJO28_006449 [Puccinia striiformis f. sp. tritici]|uniref:Uncharacterized protein n=1 Tax=Puccinia striiformis f. sp. tritici TaxID=168172 RepID=A0ACC0EJ68_9BASI|nr:hypothetical protein MJO28_006449 [Puccinia striiformis f. sp. tritici]KAI7958210.1 hypothetical protein MJO29_006427 [Puccinia striiformis f. sp. tritici]